MFCGLENEEFKKDVKRNKIRKKNPRAFLVPIALYNFLSKQLGHGVYELDLNPIVVSNSLFSYKEIRYFSDSEWNNLYSSSVLGKGQ